MKTTQTPGKYACQTCGTQHNHTSEYTSANPESFWQPCESCDVETCEHGIKHGATDRFACTQCVLVQS